MEALNTILKDMRSVMERSQEPIRKYERSAPVSFKPEQARFKLVVWFKDGNRRYFHSFDTKKTKEGIFTDEYEGLVKLLRLVHSYEGKYKNAIIYANCDPGKPIQANFNFEVIKWDLYGNRKENKTVNFKTDGKNVIFDYSKANYLQKFKI